MGLDTSHDCWHGAYSAFSRWRQKLAEVAGYAVWEVMADMGGGVTLPHETIMLDWGHVTEKNLKGEWSSIPADPLIILFAHSDCDGEIVAEHCGPLADAIEKLIPLLPEGDGAGHVRNWRDTTQRFVDGLRKAASAGESVDFH